MSDKTVHNIAKEELTGAKTMADVDAGFERTAARVGKRVPTAAEVFAGALHILQAAGVSREGQLTMAKLLGQSVRAVMDRSDAEAAARSEFAEAGPADSTWEVWPNSSSYSN